MRRVHAFLIVGIALVAAPVQSSVSAQAAATPPGTAEWQGWAFGRLGLASTSSRDHFFVATAAGAADVTPTSSSDQGGSSVGSRSGAFAYDLSSHGAYRLAGFELALSGVLAGLSAAMSPSRSESTSGG